MADPAGLPPVPLTHPRRGYPNRGALDAAQSRLRSQLARLGRDNDTVDQAGILAARAAAALDEVHQAALKAEEQSPRQQARMQREQRRLDAARRRAGLPRLPTPERPGDAP